MSFVDMEHKDIWITSLPAVPTNLIVAILLEEVTPFIDVLCFFPEKCFDPFFVVVVIINEIECNYINER